MMCGHTEGLTYSRVEYAEKRGYAIRGRCRVCGKCEDYARWYPRSLFAHPEALPLDREPHDARQLELFP